MKKQHENISSIETKNSSTENASTEQNAASIPDEILQYLPAVLELGEALQDIPAQIETLSRCTLASNFIYRDQSGTKFDAEKFEKAWEMITNSEITLQN